MTWETILNKIINGETNIPSPFHVKGILNSFFVIVDKEKKYGYALIWCSVTHKAVQFSRIKIPETEKITTIFSEDLQNMEPIEYHLQDISVFTKEMKEIMNRR